jgi:hypothetical protein
VVGSIQGNGTQFKASFDVNYQPVSSTYPANTPAEVVVQQGETLQLIAQRVWGDPSLWYLIAAANGLSDPSATLVTGRVLHLPNSVVSVSNSANSFKPYDVNAVIGDATPTQPAPPPASQGGCGVLGMVLMIIAAIVVTIYTAVVAGVPWERLQPLRAVPQLVQRD